jgi:uncharacterized protein YecE (DUF72 family)
MSRLYCGTSGWIYQHWRGVFYPEGLGQAKWLQYYAGRFDTVEINNSFYRLPEKSTFGRWRDESPPGFTFSVKASRFLTHMKKLKDPEDPLRRVLENSEGLGPKRGPILYQLPPNWHANLDRLERFLAILPAGVRHVFEFRDDTWQREDVWSLLERYSAGYCIMDSPGLPLHIRSTADFSYIRMHYGLDNGDYGRRQLIWWSNTVKKLLEHGDVYIYFNNDQSGCAVKDALALIHLVRD